MTIRERMLAAYRGDRPDQTPVAIYGRYLPRGSWERELRALGLGIIDWHPVASLLAPPWHPGEGYLSEVRGSDLQVDFGFEHGQKLETRTYRTPVGAISQRTVKDPGYGSDWAVEHYIKSIDDYRVMQYLVENTVFRSGEQTISARRAELGEDGVVFGRLDRSPYQKLLIELAGPERLFEDYLTTPSPVLALLQAMEEKMEEALSLIPGSSAEVIWQPENLTADMTPPRYFEKHCLPLYCRVADLLEGTGKLYAVHMDGRLGPLKALIAQSPFDVLESFSLPDVGGDMTLSEALAAWPDKAIVPNFPSSLCHGRSDRILAFLDAFLADGATGRCCLLEISEDLPAGEYERVLRLACRHVARHGRARE